MIPKLTCYFDGACAPQNPFGNMGYGYVILENNYILQTYSGFEPSSFKNSNNVAEYLALINCLEFLIYNNQENELIEIFGDSKLVVNQMNEYWRIKSGLYYKYALCCKELFDKFTNCTIKWIPRELNTLADEASKKEFKERGIIDLTDKKQAPRINVRLEP